jgi:hypothetical protein
MDWASLRQEPSDNLNIVATNRNTWLTNAQGAAQAEATESERNAQAAIKAEREAANSLVVNMYRMGNVWKTQADTDFILQRETIQEQGDNTGANDMVMWEQEQNLNLQQQNWFTGHPQFEEAIAAIAALPAEQKALYQSMSKAEQAVFAGVFAGMSEEQRAAFAVASPEEHAKVMREQGVVDDKSKQELMLLYNIIDIITISNNTNKQVVYNCNLLIEAIFARVDQSYTIINLKKNGGNVPGGWEYIYIVCELILNTEYFVALIMNGLFDNTLFTQFYDSMYGYLSSTIIQIHQIDNTDSYILGIIDHFNGLFAATQEGIQIKYEFIMKIAYHLPISFLFANRVEVEFPMLVDYMVKENPMLLDYINKKIEQDIKQKNIEQEYQFCLTQPGSDESKCHQYGSCLVTHLGANPNAISYCRGLPITAGGNNYKNNIIKKLKVKKRATKRRQHKSQKHKNRKKHKSQKQKNQRKYKSKNQRKYKSIFNKTLKRKI